MAGSYIVGWLAELSETPNSDNDLFWSGEGELTIGGKTYFGVGKFVAVSPLVTGVNQADDRLSVVVNVGYAFDNLPIASKDKLNRAEIMEDPGLRIVRVNWIYRHNDLESGEDVYKKSLVQQVGRMSSPTFDGVQYTFEIEPYRGTGHRQLEWNDSTQQARFPGDLGLSYMKIFGKPFLIRWPPPEASA